MSQYNLNKRSVFTSHWHVFIGVFFGLAACLYFFFAFVGLAPEEINVLAGSAEITSLLQTSSNMEQHRAIVRDYRGWDEWNQTNGSSSNLVTNFDVLLPTRIKIPKVGVDTPVANPQSENVTVLDEALLGGAARYPSSGNLNYGNMFIFAHSTTYAVVRNKAYQAFNGLKNLQYGDEIYVTSEDGRQFLYTVTNVQMASAANVQIHFSNDLHTLTLATCNVAGQKEERWIVEAKFVGEVF
jgi:Sortase (surface protein transpeptidase)